MHYSVGLDESMSQAPLLMQPDSDNPWSVAVSRLAIEKRRTAHCRHAAQGGNAASGRPRFDGFAKALKYQLLATPKTESAFGSFVFVELGMPLGFNSVKPHRWHIEPQLPIGLGPMAILDVCQRHGSDVLLAIDRAIVAKDIGGIGLKLTLPRFLERRQR